jgi:hypothetical protein
VVILVICFGKFFEGLRINAVLDVRTIDAKKDDLPAALDRELGIWIGWNILKLYLRRCGSWNLTFLSCPETAGAITASVDSPPKAAAAFNMLRLSNIPELPMS